jgi:hypothetical protein
MQPKPKGRRNLGKADYPKTFIIGPNPGGQRQPKPKGRRNLGKVYYLNLEINSDPRGVKYI